ncbi:hypothetical protein HN011_011467 [Eciton burchellii]|nr:hypothetical protein HN011_011467 [Eciton burchellii]
MKIRDGSWSLSRDFFRNSREPNQARNPQESTGRVRTPLARCMLFDELPQIGIMHTRTKTSRVPFKAKLRGVARGNKSAIQDSASPENPSLPLLHTHKRVSKSFTMLPPAVPGKKGRSISLLRPGTS